MTLRRWLGRSPLPDPEYHDRPRPPSDQPREPVTVEVGGWQVTTASDWPEAFDGYKERAEFHQAFLDTSHHEWFFFAAVGRPTDQAPSLVVYQDYAPAVGGFSPGVLIVPETRIVFIGAGERLLCYQDTAAGWGQLWEDTADTGFWGWRRHGDTVVMSAELELAAWTTAGLKLWTTSVEPPWSYEVSDGLVRLDVMDAITRFPLATGPTRR